MAIFTKPEFQSLAQNIARSKGNYVLNETRTFSKYASSTSVFLSHSHTDREMIAPAKTFFENLGISIYVDWADETMPEETSGITAHKIKTQIHDNDKFVLLATNDAIISRWCNWEVGIGDTYKLSTDQIALLPLADSRGLWQGNEYLQIYPRIEPSSSGSDHYVVMYPDGKRKNLSIWLNQ